MMLEAFAAVGCPLDKLISHRLPLEEADAAVALVRSGQAIRAVLELA